MNTLENRLSLEEEIQVYEEVLQRLYKERKTLIKECCHEIRIVNLEEGKKFPYFLERKEYCLLCGKPEPIPKKILEWKSAKKILQFSEYLKKRDSGVIQMIDYPNLNEKWGENYRSEVEKIYLTIKRNSYSSSESVICFKLKETLKEMDENENDSG